MSFILILKYILAALLALLPFLVRKSTAEVNGDGADKQPHHGSLVTFLSHFLPRVWNLILALRNFASRLSRGMRRSDNSRKFYTVLLLIVLLTYTYVDFSATEVVRDIIRFTSEKGGDISVVSAVYSPMASDTLALFACQLLTFAMFSYRIADRLLVWMRDNWTYMATFDCFLLAAVAVYSQQHFIMAEVVTIFLIAAMYYPDKTGTGIPKGRKPLPTEQEQTAFKQAA